MCLADSYLVYREVTACVTLKMKMFSSKSEIFPKIEIKDAVIMVQLIQTVRIVFSCTLPVVRFGLAVVFFWTRYN